MALAILKTPSCTSHAIWVGVEADRTFNRVPSCSAISSTCRPRFSATCQSKAWWSLKSSDRLVLEGPVTTPSGLYQCGGGGGLFLLLRWRGWFGSRHSLLGLGQWVCFQYQAQCQWPLSCGSGRRKYRRGHRHDWNPTSIPTWPLSRPLPQLPLPCCCRCWLRCPISPLKSR